MVDVQNGTQNSTVDSVPFPPLQGSARPVAQDRWEKLVTTVVVPVEIGTVWAALTDPERVGYWLAQTGAGWAKPDATSFLDFEDGEFFWCRTDVAEAPSGHESAARLDHRWRWVGVGPCAEVSWQLSAVGDQTWVTVTESVQNGPADWRSWNGMGWPGILDQLSDHVLTGRNTRWTWRRMGPYVQYEIGVGAFEGWAALTSPAALQFWMGRSHGSLTVGDPLLFVLGDASGSATMNVTEHIEAGQRFPSYLPSLQFELTRGGWPGALNGHLWIEPTKLGGSLVQVFHQGWEMFGPSAIAPHDRFLLSQFWVNAFGRLGMLLGPGAHGVHDGAAGATVPGPHSWSL